MIKIRVKIQRDSFRSQIDFDDNFKRIKDDLWQYIDYSNIEPLEINELIHISRNSSRVSLVNALNNESSWPTDYADFTRDELIDELYGQDFELEELSNYLDTHSVGHSVKYDLITTRGYSQGDYAEVIVPHAVFKVWGSKPSDQSMQKMIDNYFWDAPLVGTITVNNDEHYIDEILIDLYEYDIDKIKVQIIKYIGKEYYNAPARNIVNKKLVAKLDKITEIDYIY
jgi:hypothetical protein